MKKIYLAGPYTHFSKDKRTYRFEILTQVAAHLIAAGDMVFSPITHSHPMTKVDVDLPIEWEFWEKFDRVFLNMVEELWVVMIEGWSTSTGVQAEIKIAEELNLPIHYLTGNDIKELLYGKAV